MIETVRGMAALAAAAALGGMAWAATAPAPDAAAAPDPQAVALAAGLEAAFEAGLEAEAGRAAGAAAGLEAARERLARARDGAGPVPLARALRETEAALAGLRAAIAGAGDEVRGLEHALRRDDAEIKRLVAALVAVSRQRPGEGMTLHPGGPVAAARASLLVEAAERGLAAEAERLRLRLDALEAARSLRQDGEDMLVAALEEAEAVRVELRAQVLASGDALTAPGDPVAQATLLMQESGTLSDLARHFLGAPQAAPALVEADLDAVAERAVAALPTVAVDGEVLVTRSTRGATGLEDLEAPVAGRLLRGFLEADAGGVAQPGVTLAAAPKAVVTAPAAGTIGYVGPFLDYNRVVVLQRPDGGAVLLAGLAESAVAPGQAVVAGEPIGFLGGRALDAQEFLMLPDQGNATLGAETLYMEVWRAGAPVDPGPLLGLQGG